MGVSDARARLRPQSGIRGVLRDEGARGRVEQAVRRAAQLPVGLTGVKPRIAEHRDRGNDAEHRVASPRAVIQHPAGNSTSPSCLPNSHAHDQNLPHELSTFYVDVTREPMLFAVFRSRTGGAGRC